MDAPLSEALLSLPVAPLYELLHCGTCTLCVLRFFNVRSRVYSSSAPRTACVIRELSSTIFASICKPENEKTPPETGVCIVCLGVLQASNQSAVSDAILQATVGYEFDSFCLEVSVPPSTLLRDRALWCSLRSSHEDFFKADNPSEHIVPLKEAFKWMMIPRFESLLERRFDATSGFRISLLYRHPSSGSEIQSLQSFSIGDPKRRRGKNGELQEEGESISSVQRILSSLSSETFGRSFTCPPEKVEVPCTLTASCAREAVYVGGRYMKYSRNISQSPWLVEEERMGQGSVQEIIGDAVFPAFKGDSYKFHAAGREDIDVRMLGSGRPFILEIINARVLPTQEELSKLEAGINVSKPCLVRVRGLRRTGSEVWALMREGESDKQKEYMAVVWISRPLTETDFVTLSSLKELEIQQKTPVRVLHRRSPLIRSRTIHWMLCEPLHESKQYFVLRLCSQAGTYIKEFVHGDLGRTHPSVGSLLGCQVEILCLDVTNVKMDFLEES